MIVMMNTIEKIDTMILHMWYNEHVVRVVPLRIGDVQYIYFFGDFKKVSPYFYGILSIFLWKEFISAIKNILFPNSEKRHHFSSKKMVTLFLKLRFRIFFNEIILFFKEYTAKPAGKKVTFFRNIEKNIYF